MQRRPLRQSLHRQQLRQDLRHQSQLEQQRQAAHAPRMDQQLAQLFRDALGADHRDLAGHCSDGRRGRRLDRQVEARGDAHRPQETQLVLAEANGRFANGAEHAVA